MNRLLVINEFLIGFTVILPLLSGIISALIHRDRKLKICISIFVIILFLINLINITVATIYNGELHYEYLELMPGIAISFHTEPFGLVFCWLASILWLANTMYSVSYMKEEQSGEARMNFYISISMSATIAVALSANLATMFCFYELLTLTTYPLVAHYEREADYKGSRVYLRYLLFTSLVLFLPAIIMVYTTSGTIEFTLGGIINTETSQKLTAVTFVMFLLGVGKIAIMPFHKWLPAAMVAPTPVSALLHAVAVVKTGIFVIVKSIVYIFGIDYLRDLFSTYPNTQAGIIYLASATIIIASVIALKQREIKKILAYSTVSQLSYCIAAALIMTPRAMAVSMVHMVCHGVAKITLFFCAGSFYKAINAKKIDQLNGIGKYMRITSACFFIGALSLIGIPPLAGFVSKFYILQEALKAELYSLCAAIVISTVLNSAYFFPIIHKMYFGETQGKISGEYSKIMWIPLASTAIITTIIFVYLNNIINFILSINLENVRR